MIDLELTAKQLEADRADVDELQSELDHRVRNWLIDEAARYGMPYQMAMMSCLSGRWDDLIKDIQRGRLDKEQAHLIVDTIRGARLTNDLVANIMHERIVNTEPEVILTDSPTPYQVTETTA